MVSATLPFLPAFCSVYPAHLWAALSKGQDNFFIEPMKATQIQKDLLHQVTVKNVDSDLAFPYSNMEIKNIMPNFSGQQDSANLLTGMFVQFLW